MRTRKGRDNNTRGTAPKSHSRVSILAELWAFMKVRKKWWLGPIILILLLLGLLAVPAFGMRLGMPGARVVDEGRSSRDGYELVVESFGAGAAAPLGLLRGG